MNPGSSALPNDGTKHHGCVKSSQISYKFEAGIFPFYLASSSKMEERAFFKNFP